MAGGVPLRPSSNCWLDMDDVPQDEKSLVRSSCNSRSFCDLGFPSLGGRKILSDTKAEPLEDSWPDWGIHPYLFYELIAIFVGEKVKPKHLDISRAERFYAFPNCKGIEDVSFILLEDYLYKNLAEATKQGALPKKVDLDDVLVMLMTIMVGAPLAISYEHFDTLSTHYKKQLAFLWKGLGRNDR